MWSQAQLSAANYSLHMLNVLAWQLLGQNEYHAVRLHLLQVQELLERVRRNPTPPSRPGPTQKCTPPTQSVGTSAAEEEAAILDMCVDCVPESDIACIGEVLALLDESQ